VLTQGYRKDFTHLHPYPHLVAEQHKICAKGLVLRKAFWERLRDFWSELRHTLIPPLLSSWHQVDDHQSEKTNFWASDYKIWFTINRRSLRINKNVSDVYFPCRVFFILSYFLFSVIALKDHLCIVFIYAHRSNFASNYPASNWTVSAYRVPMGIRIKCL
jgi:hypothetical protein